MQRVLITALAAAAAALSFASPASAAVTVTVGPTNGQPGTMVKASTTNTQDNNVNVYGSTAQQGASQDVKFTGGTGFLTNDTFGNAKLTITDGGGFASIGDSSQDSASLYSIIIDPSFTFTDMKFSFQLTQAGTFTVYYLLDGETNFTLANFATPANIAQDGSANTNYLVDISGGTFSAIQIVSSQPIFQLKQISTTGGTTPPVPEPATWALMLLGFGGIGIAMRRRRKGGLLQIA